MSLSRAIYFVRTTLQSCPKKLPVGLWQRPLAGSGGSSYHNRMSRDLRPAAGFTLLEVLVALTVLAIGAAITLSLISGSLGNIRKAQLRTRAIEHAEAVMELALLDDSIQEPTTFTGDFEDGMRWSVSVEEYVPPDLPQLQSPALPQNMPVKLLHYSIEMFSPDSRVSDYRLQTLKLVRKAATNRPARLPQ